MGKANGMQKISSQAGKIRVSVKKVWKRQKLQEKNKGTKYILMTYLHLGEYIAPYRPDAPIAPIDMVNSK